MNICSHMRYQLIDGEFFRTLGDVDDEEEIESEEQEEPQVGHELEDVSSLPQPEFQHFQ